MAAMGSRGFLSALGGLVMVPLPGRRWFACCLGYNGDNLRPVGAFNGVDSSLRMEQMRSGAYQQCGLDVYDGCDGISVASCLLWVAL